MAWQHECVTQVLLACYKAIFQKGHVQFDLRAAGFMPISQLDCTCYSHEGVSNKKRKSCWRSFWVIAAFEEELWDLGVVAQVLGKGLQAIFVFQALHSSLAFENSLQSAN